MWETDSSLLPKGEPSRKTKVLSVGYDETSLDELERLEQTLGVAPHGRVLIKSQQITPATYVGSGKLEEIRLWAEAHPIDAIVFDVDLTPGQLKNLEKVLKTQILDRSGVILEIFSRNARSKEAKTQVELARLEYLLPRLAHFWTHFERQRGGIGLKGMGEKQIEVDRRLVKRRIALLKKRLTEIENERRVQRAGRKDVLKVALVGYTNAGKSTLLNTLTHSEVLVEDKLFATLDPSVRLLDPFSHPPVVAIDTVGFIRNLPHSLVASFRSTLEEVLDADLILHVVDASSAEAKEEVRVTEDVLRELGAAEKPRIVVLNKMDQLSTPGEKNMARTVAPGALLVSALEESGVRRVRDAIVEFFKKHLESWDVVIPYGDGKLEAQIHAHGRVEITRHLEQGTFYRVLIDPAWAGKLQLKKYRLKEGSM